jgi:sugar-specific transcriptional regulator TrmB
LAVEDKDVAALQRLGLTEYESRIYLVLIRMGPVKASEVSFFGQVPRTKTYGAIKELERKGLLRIMPGKPDVYIPSSPNEVLTPLVTKLRRDVGDSESIIHDLTVAYESNKYVKRDAPKEAGEFWQIEGRQNLYNKLNQILSDARKSIYYSTSARGLIRAYKSHSEILERARSHDVVVRVLTSISTENRGVAEQLSQALEVKQLDESLGKFFVSVDSRELVIVESKPDDLRMDRGSDSAIWTTNKLIVELHERLFEQIWKSLPRLEFPQAPLK